MGETIDRCSLGESGTGCINFSMIRLTTTCSSGSNIFRRAANHTVVGTLVLSAIWWEFEAPRAIYERDHSHLTVLPAIQNPYEPPQHLSFVSSGHAVLLQRVLGG